jgi:hypothetical protein
MSQTSVRKRKSKDCIENAYELFRRRGETGVSAGTQSKVSVIVISSFLIVL